MVSPLLQKAFLIDLDGVLYVQEDLIHGALEAIERIRALGIPHRFVTNTTTHSRRQIISRLREAGLKIPYDHLFTAPVAAASHLREDKAARCYFFASESILEEFHDVPMVQSNPSHVIIGDAGDRFTYTLMNVVFNMVHQGAEMIALQKNRFWITREGLKLDAGAFVAALEYATGKTALVFGKPSGEFFRQACADLGFPPHEVAMIGDDLKADIDGASKAGLKTIFVQTGKDKDTPLDHAPVQPDMTLNSIADLTGLVEGTRS
jgi:HAD superfamily hydrolase (TIGR01458 family)